MQEHNRGQMAFAVDGGDIHRHALDVKRQLVVGKAGKGWHVKPLVQKTKRQCRGNCCGCTFLIPLGFYRPNLSKPQTRTHTLSRNLAMISSISGLARSAFQATAVVTTLSFWLNGRNTTLAGASFFKDAGTSAMPCP